MSHLTLFLAKTFLMNVFWKQKFDNNVYRTLIKQVKYSWSVRHLICLEFSFRICNITYRYSRVTVEKSADLMKSSKGEN